jgi:RecA/RadA recombinase
MATSLLQSIDFKLHERIAPELLPTGIPNFDAAFGGIPRESVTDIFGASSNGRSSLIFYLKENATESEE